MIDVNKRNRGVRDREYRQEIHMYLGGGSDGSKQTGVIRDDIMRVL